MFINILVFGGYAAMLVGIALYTRKKSNTVNDFLIAGSKGINGWLSAFSYGTTYFSAVLFIGYAGKFGWSFGLAAIWIGVGNAFIGGLLAWKILAKRTRNMTKRLSARTMPEFFEKRYDSTFLKVISALIVFIFLIPYSASVYSGLGYLFEVMLGIDGMWVTIGLAVLTAVYLVFGGFLATALSDLFQGFVMLAGVIIMLIFVMLAPEVNGTEGIKKLAEDGHGLLVGFGGSGFLNSPLVMLIALVLLTSFGVFGMPQTVHKYYSIRNKESVKQGMIITTLFALIIGVIAYFIGSTGLLYFKEVMPEGGAETIVPLILTDVIPKGLTALIAVLMLSASMSTLASVSLASASAVTVDLYKGVINKDASDKKVTFIMRIMCFVFILLSVVIALLNKKFNITAIAFLMSLSWGTLSGCFIGPFVLGLYNKKLTKAAAISAVVSGVSLTVVLTLVFGIISAGRGASFGTILQKGVGLSPITGVVSMLASIIIVLVVSKFTKPLDDEIVKNAFEKELQDEI